MNTGIKHTEQLCNNLRRDYRNLRKNIIAEDYDDNYTMSLLTRLNKSIEDVCKIATELSK